MSTGSSTRDGSRSGAPHRLVIVCAGVLVQVGLGSAYAWSVFRRPLSEEFGWSISMVTVTFSLFILTAGLASVLGGVWMQRSGPRPVLVASGILYGGGVALASKSADALWLLYGSYGVIAGAGMGLGTSSLSFLVMAQSAPGEVGFHTSAAQIADQLTAAVLIGAGGALLALLVVPAAALTVLVVVLTAMAVLGAVLAGRSAAVAPA